MMETLGMLLSTRRLVQSIEMNFERDPEEAEEGGDGSQSPRSLRSDTSIGLVWNKKTGLRVRLPNPGPVLNTPTLSSSFRRGCVTIGSESAGPS